MDTDVEREIKIKSTITIKRVSGGRSPHRCD